MAGDPGTGGPGAVLCQLATPAHQGGGRCLLPTMRSRNALSNPASIVARDGGPESPSMRSLVPTEGWVRGADAGTTPFAVPRLHQTPSKNRVPPEPDNSVSSDEVALAIRDPLITGSV